MSIPARLRGRFHIRSEVNRRPVPAVHEFIHVSEIAGWPLLISAIAALIWVNFWGESYRDFWHSTILLSGEHFTFARDARHWVNDALLPLLFFVAGMEIKRELLRGELADPRRAALPVLTAIGGMVVPAAIYAALNAGGEFLHGWGVPVATDIAFVLMVFSLLGDRVSSQLKILILAFALVDDIGGVLVIAFVYSSHINWAALGLAAIPLAGMIVLLKLDWRNGAIHIPLGILFWIAMLESGVHTTIAGIILGALAPARPLLDSGAFRDKARAMLERYSALEREREEARSNADDASKSHGRYLDNDSGRLAEDPAEAQDAELGRLDELVRGTESTVERLTRVINPWVSYFVLPLFALANGGIEFSSETIHDAMTSRASWGVILGLVVGKPVGFLAAVWATSRLGVTRLPGGIGWLDFVGAGITSGIGFTVSLFIADEAFPRSEAASELVKAGVLVGSLVAGVLGLGVLWWASRRRNSG